MLTRKPLKLGRLVAIILTASSSAFAQDATTAAPAGDTAAPLAVPTDTHQTEAAASHLHDAPTSSASGEADPLAPSYRATEQEVDPSLPEGMTLDQVLSRAAEPRPEGFPSAIRDNRLLAFLLWNQLEYRVDGKRDADVLGYKANAWVGGDFNRLALKPEGEVTFEHQRSLQTETDILYSRLIAPFWSAQIGAQYANQWKESERYQDRWSGAIALQGLAPGKFEVEWSTYVSEHGDFTSRLELEYDWRITQRLVAQPRTELTVAFQDIPERNMGAGLTDVVAGFRLRYELKREFAPYLGFRYQGWVFESADRTRAAGEAVSRFFVVAGFRLAFL